MKIYTKAGDLGESGLASGERVPKDDTQLEAYGTVDELNTILGLLRTEKLEGALDSKIARLQNELFDVGADLATTWKASNTKIKRLTKDPTEKLEHEIDEAQKGLPELRQFILPGGTKVSSLLHVARTVCRRAERQATTLLRAQKCNPQIVVYLNRLSDWFFVMARFANQRAGQADVTWKST